MHDHHDQPDAQSGNVSEAAHLEKDPVCGMNVDPGSAKHSAEYGGRTYSFCSQGCKTKFAADPVSYIGEKPKPLAPVPESTIYTCPMHPEIRQTAPGNCPICGMTLEPEVASSDSGPNPELADMTRRFWIALALSLPVVVLEMGGHLLNLHIARDAQFEHVHADRHGYRRRLGLQRRRDIGAGSFSASVPGRGRFSRDLFRGRRGHHRSRAARPGAGAPGA
jgi:YHS domain-containing protein